MVSHAAQSRRSAKSRAASRVVGAAVLTAGLVAGFAPVSFAGAVNSATVTVTSNQSTVTSGDLIQYTITVKNVGGKPSKAASLSNNVTNGTTESIEQTSGPDSWTCTQPSTCTLAAGMAVGATDTFTAIVKAGSPGTMTDTASVTIYDYNNGPTTSSGSATTTVTSGSNGGGNTITVSGFCKSTGCTISSTSGNPTTANTTVSRVSFPACQYATPATQSLCNKGFSYSYTLGPASFCSVNAAGGGECTGSTANLGDLTVSTLPQFQDANHPIVVQLVYDASITTGLSDQNGTLFNYKSTTANGPGDLLPLCAVDNSGACNAGQTTVPDSNDGDTDLQGTTHLKSSDPYVGNYYVI